MVGRHKKNRFCANGFESFFFFFLEILKKYSGFFLFVKIIYLLGHPTRESAFKYIFRKYQYGGGLLLESYLIMVKCYIYLIWKMNIWKVRKWWCCLFWDLWLVKVKVTIQSFLLPLSRGPPPFLLRVGVENMSVIMVGRRKKIRFCANGFESFGFFLEFF